jgi:hypothetical protein
MSAQELFASLRVELTEDPRQTAGILADFGKAWGEMLDKIGLEVEASISLNERVRPRGPRKPKLVIGLPPRGDAA